MENYISQINDALGAERIVGLCSVQNLVIGGNQPDSRALWGNVVWVRQSGMGQSGMDRIKRHAPKARKSWGNQKRVLSL